MLADAPSPMTGGADHKTQAQKGGATQGLTPQSVKPYGARRHRYADYEIREKNRHHRARHEPPEGPDEDDEFEDDFPWRR